MMGARGGATDTSQGDDGEGSSGASTGQSSDASGATDSGGAGCQDAPATAEEFVAALAVAMCAKTFECLGVMGELDDCIQEYLKDLPTEGCSYICDAAACTMAWTEGFTCETYNGDPPCHSALLDCPDS